ncbi:MAG: hypothetical protein VB878_06075, partial [Pirellulaceae bacterium]
GVQLGAQVLARAAILEDRHAMIFGTYGGEMRGGNTDSTLVIADAPICSLVALITIAEFKASYRGEGAPPLVSGYASEGSVMPDMTVERLRIEWGSAVPSVLVYVDDEPFALIVASEKQGYSKAIVKPGPWGQPWNEETLNGTA